MCSEHTLVGPLPLGMQAWQMPPLQLREQQTWFSLQPLPWASQAAHLPPLQLKSMQPLFFVQLVLSGSRQPSG
jgi:hypothetical protein